jgi:hypothetical protein
MDDVTTPDDTHTGLSDDAVGAIRLGGKLWVAAAAGYFVIHLWQAATFRASSLNPLLRLAWGVYQPSIVGGTSFVGSWMTSSFPLRIETGALMLTALAWTAAAWLLSDTPVPKLRATAVAVRVAAAAVLLLGIAYSVFMWRLPYRWALVVTDVLDPLLALMVSMHLRKLAAFVVGSGFARVVETLPWVIGAALALRGMERAAATNEMSGRLAIAITVASLAYSALLFAAMLLLWGAQPRPILTAEPVSPEQV